MSQAEEIALLRELESMRSNNPFLFRDLKRANHLSRALGDGAIDSVLMTRAARPYDGSLRSYADRLPVRPELFQLAEVHDECQSASGRKGPGFIWGQLAILGGLFALIGLLVPFPSDQLEFAHTIGKVGLVVAGVGLVIQVIRFAVFWTNVTSAYAPYNVLCNQVGLPDAARASDKG